ncbi:MAG TPA: hypothetical protein VF595_08195 [Tepidisphaeraceae bacterium]|jgi:hypothetical protein
MRWRTAIFLLAGVALTAGCRDRQEAAPPPPATQIATTSPATRPAEEPLPSTFIIAGQSFLFPPGKLVVQERDEGLRVTLFSIDPPEAVRDGYTGNSFYFRFTIDADAAEDLSGQQFVFRNSVAEQDDNTNGLFIAGGRQTLRPVDAVVNFDRVDRQLVVSIGGTFRVHDQQAADDAQPVVKAQAMLEPLVVELKK